MIAVLYLIPCAALSAAWAATWWRCRTLRRALDRERAVARLDQAVWARDAAALEEQHRAAVGRQERECAVLEQAAAVVDAVLAAAGRESDNTRRGGIDG